MNVTPQVESGYTRNCPVELAESTESTIEIDTPRTSNTLPVSSLDEYNHLPSSSPIFETPTSATGSFQNHNSFGEEQGQCMETDTLSSESTRGGVNAQSDFGGRQGGRNAPIRQLLLDDGESSRSRINTEDAADLLALRYMEDRRRPVPSAHTEGQLLMSPQTRVAVPRELDKEPSQLEHDFNMDDGIFVPGSVYQEFHSALRDHLIYTARSNAPTRYGTPEVPELGLGIGSTSRLDDLESDSDINQLSKIPEVTPQREYVLWKCWIDELAPWVCVFQILFQPQLI